MVTEITQFLAYRDRVRSRTRRVTTCPRERFAWSLAEGKFTQADIIRHLAGIERYMFGEGLMHGPIRYPGYGRELDSGNDRVPAYSDRLSDESIDLLRALTPKDLQPKVQHSGGISNYHLEMAALDDGT